MRRAPTSPESLRMPDYYTIEERSAHMGRVRGSETGPEIALRRALRRLGVRPTATNDATLPGKPDFVLRRARLACFVDGELWHGVQWRRRGLACLDQQFEGARNRSYWVRKVQRNMERDLRATASLCGAGWSVLRFWAGDVERDADQCARRVLVARDRPRASTLSGVATAASACFFGGAGPMRMGLESAGWRTAWVNEGDGSGSESMERGPDGERVRFDGRSVGEIKGRDVPRVGLYAARLPDARASSAEARQAAFPGFAKLLSSLGARRPLFVLLEHEVGLIARCQGRDLRLVLEQLAGARYRIDAMVIDLARFGAGDAAAMFVVGVRDDVNVQPWRPAQASPGSDALRSGGLMRFVARNTDLPWALRPMPPLPEEERELGEVIEGLSRGEAARASAVRWVTRNSIHPIAAEVLRGRLLRLSS